MTECRHGLSEDCPACMQATIDALVKALRELVDYGGTTSGWDDARRYAQQVLSRRSEVAYNRDGLRCIMSPLEIAQTAAHHALTPAERGGAA